MAPNSALFLVGETREQPMHVAGLQLYSPAPGQSALDVRDMFDAATDAAQVNPLFLKRPRRSVATLGQWGWEPDDEFEIEHHVRRSALPRPGHTVDLLTLCGRLHSSLLDRQRPLWEMHLIEGLQDGRFATYFKVHHSLMDGVSALRLLNRVLSSDPHERDMPAPWGVPRDRAARSTPGQSPAALANAALKGASELAALGPALRRRLNATPRQRVPRTMFNVPITGSRRVATQAWSLDRLKAISAATATTVNDVVLAMCSGALRSYLLAADALPEQSLVAMVPVALAHTESSDGGGNAVGAVLCDLGTHHGHPVQRMEAVRTSMLHGKAELAEMTQVQALALSALALSPIAVQHVLRTSGRMRPPFNVIISNVPGPGEVKYWNGARLDALFPMSLPLDGQALNITCTSYADEMVFGIVGCRRTVPHLQRLITFMDEELDALEAALV
jgi:diacylglycerol O-acyltransferase